MPKRKRAGESIIRISEPDDNVKKTKTDNTDGEILHYTKSGKLDMRFKSSREYLARQKLNATFHGGSVTVTMATTAPVVAGTSRGHSLPMIHIRGPPEMEKNDSETTVSVTLPTPLAMEKDSDTTRSVTTPMFVRNNEDTAELSVLEVESKNNSAITSYSTPSGPKQQAAARVVEVMEIVEVIIPDHVPLTRKSKLPDIRTNVGRKWVEDQAKKYKTALPSWLPRLKDGSLDTAKAVTRLYLDLQQKKEVEEHRVYNNADRRLTYYHKKLADKEAGFDRLVQLAKQEPVVLPPFLLLPNSEILRSYSGELENFDDVASEKGEASASFYSARGGSSSSGSSSASETDYKIPTYIPQLDYKTLEAAIGDKSDNKIGRGAFGVVYKTKWNGQEVAMKKLHLDKLTNDDKRAFMLELKILASFGDHPNLVKLYGYTTEPATFIMEYVRLGSLSHLLYYCKDSLVEARLCDGRIKKRITAGIINGMRQLHSVGIIHGDLKPCNILVTNDFNAKITDFGLSKLRGKTSSLIASRVLQGDGDNAIGGTAAYLAPELLRYDAQQHFSADVYSFGILLNELIHEEEPYCDIYHKIRLMGPFGAAQLASQGQRPRMNTNIVPEKLQMLIKRCWTSMEWYRPTFSELVVDISKEDMIFPNII